MAQSQTVEQKRRPSVETLVGEHSRQLRSWLALRVPQNDIDNASQEIWLRVSSHYETKFDGVNFRAWLFQIARNYLVDESRRRKPLPHPEENFSYGPDQRSREPCEILIDREYRSRLASCIDKLGEPRQGIVKAKAAGMGYDEFVAAMNLTNQQASQHFFAARKLLRACLETSVKEPVK